MTDELRQLAEDMIEVMYDEPGIGLAAPQVGEPVRLIVVDTEWTDEDSEAWFARGQAGQLPTEPGERQSLRASKETHQIVIRFPKKHS